MALVQLSQRVNVKPDAVEYMEVEDSKNTTGSFDLVVTLSSGKEIRETRKTEAQAITLMNNIKALLFPPPPDP